MKFWILIIVTLIITACNVSPKLDKSAKPFLEETEEIFSLNNTKVVDEAILTDDLQFRDELAYVSNTDKPYSGFSKSLHENGQLESLVKFENGYVFATKFWRTDGSAEAYIESNESFHFEIHVGLWELADLGNSRGSFYEVFDELEPEWRSWMQEPMTIFGETVRLKSEGGTITPSEDGETITLAKLWRKIVFWHESEQVVLVMFCSSEGLVDKVVTYFENGQKSSQSEFKDGLYWKAKTYKPNGESAEENVVNGNGKLMLYRDNGNLYFVETIKNGKLNGDVTKYYDDGGVNTRWTYQDNERLSEERHTYHENGQLKEKDTFTYKNNERLHEESSTYYENGQLKETVTYKNNVPLPKERSTYYENGKLRERVTYENIERHTEERHTVERSTSHENAQLKGNVTHYENTTISSKSTYKAKSTYKDGELNGEAVTFYGNGQVKEKLTYKKDKMNVEPHLSISEQGIQNPTKFLKGNKLDGEYIRYREDGSISSKSTYKDGELIE